MLNQTDNIIKLDLSKSQRTHQDAPMEITEEVIKNSYMFAYEATGNVHYLNQIKDNSWIIREVYKEVA